MGYYLKVNNVKLYVEDLNPECKKTILFLHGWPGSHKLFEYQFDKLPIRVSVYWNRYKRLWELG